MTSAATHFMSVMDNLTISGGPLIGGDVDAVLTVATRAYGLGPNGRLLYRPELIHRHIPLEDDSPLGLARWRRAVAWLDKHWGVEEKRVLIRAEADAMWRPALLCAALFVHRGAFPVEALRAVRKGVLDVLPESLDDTFLTFIRSVAMPEQSSIDELVGTEHIKGAAPAGEAELERARQAFYSAFVHRDDWRTGLREVLVEEFAPWDDHYLTRMLDAVERYIASVQRVDEVTR